MFALTLLVGPQGTPWTLIYKTQETAASAQSSYNNTVHADAHSFVISDDFGQSVSIPASDLHGSMLEDLQQSQLAHIERALHHGRTNAKVMEAAQADPVLKAAAARQQMGPAIINPMGGNGSMPFRPM